MNTIFRNNFGLSAVIFNLLLVVSVAPTIAAEADPLAAVKSRTELDALIASAKDPTLKEALRENANAIMTAVNRRPHVDRVIAVLEKAHGSFTRANDTPEKLKSAIGGPSAVFDSLKEINLADTGLTIKEKRTTDPFDAAFYEDVSEINGLESLNIINTTAQNGWLAPLVKLTSLKVLRITNQSKLNDEGLALLAGLRQLEQFSYVGTAMTGEPFKDFKGWTALKRSSYRGNRMNDAGLIALCEAFPNLQSLVLAHGHYTDAAVAKLAGLTQLTGLEIGSNKATPQCLTHLLGLKLEYLQLGDGLDSSAGIAIIKNIKTLKRLTLTNSKPTTDDDLKVVASMTHLESLEFGGLELPAERLPQLKQFSFLKFLRLVRRPQPYDAETQAKIKELLPNVELKFD